MSGAASLAFLAAALVASLLFWVFVLSPSVHETARFMELKHELYDEVLEQGGPDADAETLMNLMLGRARKIYSERPNLLIAYAKVMLTERRDACMMTLLIVGELRMAQVRKDVAKLVVRGGTSKFKMTDEDVAQAKSVLATLDEVN